ncbi:MAG: histidine phosphatase family protein [Candidatus Microsaccharimonas sp.]
MKVYFVRHGHMDATTDTPVDPINGQIDKSLCNKGVQQANHVANELKSVKFDAIFSSNLKRASQTAETINQYHRLTVNVSEVWRERDTGGYVTAEVWKDLFDFNKNLKAENIEDLLTFFERIYLALDDLKKDYMGKTVAIVSHGGVHQALYAYANKLKLSGNVRNSPLGNCEYRVYDL